MNQSVEELRRRGVVGEGGMGPKAGLWLVRWRNGGANATENNLVHANRMHQRGEGPGVGLEST